MRFTMLTVVGLLLLLGCAGKRAALDARNKTQGQVRHLDGEGISNFYALSQTLYSGAAPEGDSGFETLRRLGVKTIITVDGSAPQADLAAKHGLKYVHLPIGYDGTSRTNALRIVKAAQVMPGPIFVHCHHGMHRGPAAAALIGEALEGWSSEQAEAWLRAAGTSTNYPGLYRMVREFKPPSAVELRDVPRHFTSRATTSDLVQTMIQVDEHFDLLKDLRKAGFKPLPGHADATAASESLMLWELFREAHRARQGAARGEDFLTGLKKASATAQELHLRLKDLEARPAQGTQAAEKAFQNVTEACASCHKSFRN